METRNSFQKLIRSAVAVLLAGLIPTGAPGEDGVAGKFSPIGGEFQVNSYTTGRQRYPSVAVDADGDFVVVWHSPGSGGTDSDRTSVQGQRYASDGSSLGGEFQVNSYTTRAQGSPSVAVAADGDFVVVWHSGGSGGTDSSDYSIQGQRYASDGSPLDGQFQVNSYTTDRQIRPSVAVDADGDFVVVWDSSGVGITHPSDVNIQGQRYASDGFPLGGQFQVNSYTTTYPFFPSVAVDADGDFVVVWSSSGSGGTDSDRHSVQGQRYASDGSPRGGEFQINSYTTSSQYRSSVAVDTDGDFVVVWQSYGSGTDSSGISIQGQRYASDGSPLSGEFQINSYRAYNGAAISHNRPSVAVDTDGDFVVVWRGVPDGIQGQRFASDGSALGGQFQVNSYTTDHQNRPSVAVDANGNFVVVWDSYFSGGTDSSSSSIQSQRFTALFADGFESGDTLAWSSTVP